MVKLEEPRLYLNPLSFPRTCQWACSSHPAQGLLEANGTVLEKKKAVFQDIMLSRGTPALLKISPQRKTNFNWEGTLRLCYTHTSYITPFPHLQLQNKRRQGSIVKKGGFNILIIRFKSLKSVQEIHEGCEQKRWDEINIMSLRLHDRIISAELELRMNQNLMFKLYYFFFRTFTLKRLCPGHP